MVSREGARTLKERAGVNNPITFLSKLLESDTIIAIGERIECPFFEPSTQTEDNKPFCTHFQINPVCTGDINRCDVLMFAPDPRDGYR